jgi:oleate hydratase
MKARLRSNKSAGTSSIRPWGMSSIIVRADRASEPSVVGRKSADRSTSKVYLVGSGIASLAAAAFMLRDCDVPGNNITVFEELDTLVGSLDGSGSPQSYALRGGWMLENKYLCSYELFSSIPTLDGSKTVMQEIFGWSETMKTSPKLRPARDGHRQTATEFSLSEKRILTIERLARDGQDQRCKSVRSHVLLDQLS